MSERNELESSGSSSKVKLANETDLEEHDAICPHSSTVS